MIRTCVTFLLIISVSGFIFYFVNNQETFSPCINCHLTPGDHTIKKYKEESEEMFEERKTLLDLDDVKNTRYTVELDSILKSPEEQKSFIPSQSFTGQRDGYVFKNGRHGNGYYLDRHVQFNL